MPPDFNISSRPWTAVYTYFFSCGHTVLQQHDNRRSDGDGDNNTGVVTTTVLEKDSTGMAPPYQYQNQDVADYIRNCRAYQVSTIKTSIHSYNRFFCEQLLYCALIYTGTVFYLIHFVSVYWDAVFFIVGATLPLANTAGGEGGRGGQPKPI